MYGEIPVAEFLSTFMPRRSLRTLKANITARLNARDIPKDAPTDDGLCMCVALVSLSTVVGSESADEGTLQANAVRKSTICPSFFVEHSFKFRSKADSEEEEELRAGCGLFRRRTPLRNQRHLNGQNFTEEIDVLIDMRPERCLDPFHVALAHPEGAAENLQALEDKRETERQRQQQMNRVSLIMSLQHRTHLFSISIVGHRARFLRWDRAGVVVSEAFDYFEDGFFLAEFLLRYEHSTPEQRGRDFTATEATPQEVRNFLDGATAFLKTHLAKEWEQELRKSIDSTTHTYKLRVPIGPTGLACIGSYSYAEYIVRRPFITSGELFGRETRGYLAWGCTEKKIVFLKDSWRPSAPSQISEADTYQNLGRSKTLHLPVVHSAGDVLGGNFQPQYTQTGRFKDRELSWPQPENPCETRCHHRVVQDWAMSLCMARNSKQVVQAIRNALVGTFKP